MPRDRPFEAFLDAEITARGIDTVLTFNDALPRHRAAKAIAARRGLRHLVLENGYLRPHFVTLERRGADGTSSVSRDPVSIRAAAPLPDEPRFPVRIRDHVLSTIGHFLAAEALRPLLSYDRSVYGAAVPRQAIGYSREYVWRLTHREEAAAIVAHRDAGGRVVLVLLQKPGDSQLRLHSRFGSVAPFLDTVLRSFAAHAPEGLLLVVKQHPLDHGDERLPQIFAGLAAELGLAPDRALYRRKTPIATLLAAADQVVTVNSTGGLEALLRGLPVKCLGTAIYDLPGLTDPKPLDRFWREPTPPDVALVAAFRNHLRHSCQVEGGFHTRAGRRILAPKLARRILDALS